ncbi:MAG: lysylphosphatidylglycerol synthase transmembrane domain-containing protein [Chloroflexota bacterium]
MEKPLTEGGSLARPAAGSGAPEPRTRGEGGNGGGVSLRKRLLNAKTILSFLVAALLLFTVFRKLGDFSAAAAQIRQVDLGVYGLAFVVYAFAFPSRGLRWQRLLKNVGEEQPAGPLINYLFLSWFVNCLVPAKIGDVYRSYLLKKNRDVSMSKSVGTVFAERIIDTITIFLAFGVTGLMVFRSKLPPEVRLIVAAGIALGLLMVGVLIFMRHFGEAVVARLAPARFQASYKSFQEGTLGSFKAFEVVGLFTFLAWTFEASRLFLVAHSLAGGTPMLAHFSFLTAIFAMVTGSILTLVPTPGGLGAVEGGLTGVLILVGLQPGVALAIVILDRFISYWGVVATGALDYFVGKAAR